MRISHLVAASLVVSSFTFAQSVHATRVLAADDNGQAGGGLFDSQLALGAPDGFPGIYSLGNGGSLTLGFDVVIQDGPGADLIIAENPFASATLPWETFAEVCFVEVSSDGITFARIPTRYTGPAINPGPFSFVESGWYSGFGGVHTLRTSTPDVQDLVMAGGDAIDLADLAGDPLVTSGQVDLQNINAVRLVDVQSGIDVDSQGVLVRDPGSGSADIDGVTVIHHSGNAAPNGPEVDVNVAADGSFAVTISDPDGLGDIEPSTLGFALWGIPLDPVVLFQITNITAVSATSITLELPGALPFGIDLHVGVSLRDFAGNRSSDSSTQS